MKHKFYIVSVSFFLLFLSGCLTTLYPIFHPEDAIFKESLLGYWKCVDQEKNISFMEFKRITPERKLRLPAGLGKISDKGYVVSQMDKKENITSQHLVFLAKIGKYYYLDYYPLEMAPHQKINKIYKNHVIKMHTNYRCDLIDNDHFETRLFDKPFLDKLLSKNKINIRHETIGGNNFITAPTDELKIFIKQYGDNPEAFGRNISYYQRILTY